MKIKTVKTQLKQLVGFSRDVEETWTVYPHNFVSPENFLNFQTSIKISSEDQAFFWGGHQCAQFPWGNYMGWGGTASSVSCALFISLKHTSVSNIGEYQWLLSPDTFWENTTAFDLLTFEGSGPWTSDNVRILAFSFTTLFGIHIFSFSEGHAWICL